MKKTLTKILTMLAVVTAMNGGTAYAQTPASDAQNHEQHHPEGQAPGKVAEKPMEGGMMDSMKMDGMKDMMHKCMEMHKNGKMCEHDTMEKCQANMKKGECQKMMKQATAQDKKDKTKK